MTWRITVLHNTYNIHSPKPRTEVLDGYQTAAEANEVAKFLLESFKREGHAISYTVTGCDPPLRTAA